MAASFSDDHRQPDERRPTSVPTGLDTLLDQLTAVALQIGQSEAQQEALAERVADLEARLARLQGRSATSSRARLQAVPLLSQASQANPTAGSVAQLLD